jgi:5-methylcytosine-specific restriction endonuclease McrA
MPHSRKYKRMKSNKRKLIKSILWDSQPHQCAYCKKPFLDKSEATLDHIVPKCRAGTDDLSNLCLACKECNDAKANQNAKKFRKRIRKNI